MHGTLTQIRKISAVKDQNDRILSYSVATSATLQIGSDRVVVLDRGPRGWTVPATALAMIMIALATLVGGGATTWHYWNEEKRAAKAKPSAFVTAIPVAQDEPKSGLLVASTRAP